MKDITKIKDLPSADCFSLEQLFQFVDRNMPDEKLRYMEKHIEVCDFCADAVAGYKKVDRLASKHSLVDINKKIQQKTGVEEGEVIIKPDYRVAMLIAACLILGVGIYFGIQFFSSQDTMAENENSQTIQPSQDSSSLLQEAENTVGKKDSTAAVDSTKATDSATAPSGMAMGITGSTGTENQLAITGAAVSTPTGSTQVTQTVAAPPIPQGPRKYPQFPGGEKSLGAYISTNRKYPQEAREKGIHGFVKIGFTLDENGKVVKTRIIKGIGGGCDEEAARLFMSMPNWAPSNDGTKNLGGEYVWDVEF